MPVPAYPKPPIIEAVVELRFETRAAEAAIGKAAFGLKKKYVRSEEQALISFATRPNGPPRASSSFNGVKLSKADQSEIAVIARGSFSRSMLTPYAGFDTFRASILDDWQACQPVYKGMLITRIGMRFINRIDVPSSDRIDLAKYVRVVVNLPNLQRGPVIEQNCRVVVPLSGGRMICFINVATVPSPLMHHQSFVLDIEVAQDTALPQKTSELFDMVDEFRDSKNRVFEACITDASRTLFGDK